jgi:hypothetical protein
MKLLLALLLTAPDPGWDAFDKARGNYSNIPETHYVFCRERSNPLERADCSETPWRRPQ